MSLFRRGKKAATPVEDVQTSAVEDDLDAALEASGDAPVTGPGAYADAQDTQPAEESAPEVDAVRARGPYDRRDVEGPEGRLDLGSLWVAGIPGMELRLEVDDESQGVVGVTAVLGESAVQLQAFAAPRSEGLWDEIRSEIAASITRQGGTADIVTGPLGTELQTRMPGQGPDGRTVYSPARFLGVDGPRWFLRAVISGRAAVDLDAAAPLVDVVRATVVVRGDEAMAPRELLPLQLPAQPQHTEGDGSGGPAEWAGEDLSPFDRGPEITEIR